MKQIITAGLGLLLVAPAQAGYPSAPRDGQVNVIGKYLETRTRARTFSGVVLVAQGDRIVFERGYGEANYEDGTKNTPSTLFRIASITKPLVATSALALVANGQLNLDVSICSILTTCPASWSPVTVRNLLSFTRNTRFVR